MYAARAVLPGMVERGRGRFLVTASAAGLLSNIDSAPYTVTKHGSVALAEGRFLVLPHPEVADYEQRRASDRDRWLAAMRRLRARLLSLAP